MKRYAGLGALGLLALALTSCQAAIHSTATDAVRVACRSFEPITYSGSGDEPETVLQIQAHNRVYLELCGDP